MARAELRRDQAHRMVDTAHDIYDKEDKRITSATKHDVIVGYLSIMKQDYVLMRSRIQELERVFDVVRDHFPGEGLYVESHIHVQLKNATYQRRSSHQF